VSPLESTRRLLNGWARTNPSVATVVSPVDDDQVRAVVRDAGTNGVVARGLGRSYGDAAQNSGGTPSSFSPCASVYSGELTG